MLWVLTVLLMLAGLVTLTLDVPNTYAQSAGEGAPATPEQPAGTAIWMGMMDVEWNEVPGAETYEVQYFNMSGWADLPGNGIRIAFYGAGAVVRGLSPSSSYTFRVRAVNSHGASEWSSFGWVPQTDGPSAWRNVPEPANVAATGVPTISGTMETGETLTADTSEISDENGTERVWFHYQWIARDGTTDTDIAGATGQSYTITGDEAGDSFKVRVSFTDRHGFSESLTYDPLANVAATGAPTISGNLRVRQTLSADASAIADENGTDSADFIYQWMAVDTTIGANVEIAGATSSTYRLADEYQDRPVKVRVSFTDDLGYEESLTSEATRPIEAVGRDRIGRPEACPDDPPTPTTVTATTTPIVVDSTEDDYFVLYATFTVGGETLEHPVQVKLGEDGTTTLSENVEALSVDRYRVEKYLVDDPGDVDGDCVDDITELKDFAGKNPVNSAPPIDIADAAFGIPDRATFETLSYKGGDLVHYLSLLPNLEFVMFFMFGMDTDRPVVYLINTENRMSYLGFGGYLRGTLGSLREDLGPPTDMRGVLVYHPDVAAPDGSMGVYRFEFPTGWHRSMTFEHVAHAYGVLAANMPLLDGNLMFHPIARMAQYGYSSDRPLPLAMYESERDLYDASRVNVLLDENIPNRPAQGAPTISGRAQVGRTLEVSASGITDPDTLINSRTYCQWIRSDGSTDTDTDTDIEGATSSSYLLTSDDLGKTIKVRISFTDHLGNKEALTSKATAVVVRANRLAKGAVSINGTVRAGRTLTADTTGIADEDGLDDVAYAYQWLAGDADIENATSSAYLLRDSDGGRTFRVRVSFTDDAGNDESLTSAGLDPPSRPYGLTATVAGRTVVLNWNPAVDFPFLIDYRILRNRPELGETEPLVHADTRSTDTTYTDTNVEPGTLYVYRVKASSFTWFSDVSEAAEVRTPASTTATTTELPQLTASVRDVPDSHGGTAFTFELRFSEEPVSNFSYRTLRDHAFEVDGGDIAQVRRLDGPSNIRWEITVELDGSGDVSIVLPATQDCAASGAVCTSDGRMLSNRLELNVPGPTLTSETTSTSAVPNPTPHVVPRLREWEGGVGDYTLSATARIVVSAGDGARHFSGDFFAVVLGGLNDPEIDGLTDAQQLAARLALADSVHATAYHTSSRRTLHEVAAKIQTDIAASTGWTLTLVTASESMRPRAGDVVVDFLDASDAGIAAEGYELEIGDRVTIRANTTSGVFYGSRTLLQMLALSGNRTAPRGTARDYPSVGHRLIHLDANRKYWEMDYLADSLRRMSWVKLNAFKLHFADANGWRLHDAGTPAWSGVVAASPTAGTATDVTGTSSLGAPTAVSVKPGDGTLTVRWEPPDAASNQVVRSYRVQIRRQGDSDWSPSDYRESVGGGTAYLTAVDRTHAFGGLTNGATYQMRVSADTGFPGLADSREQYQADDPKWFYNREDIRALESWAAENHITIMPGFEFPGHTLVINDLYATGFADGGSDRCGEAHVYGNVKPGFVLDTTSERAVAQAKAIIEHFMPWFSGPYVHIGGEEVSSKLARCPRVSTHIAATPEVTSLGDMLTVFFNDLNALVRDAGRSMIIYNGVETLKPNTAVATLDPSILVMDWNASSYSYYGGRPGSRSTRHQFFKMRASDGQYLTPNNFHVLYPDEARLYDRWRVEPVATYLGAAIGVWLDYIYWSEDEYTELLLRRPRAILGDRTWNGSATPETVSDFYPRFEATGDPPGYVGFSARPRVDDDGPSHHYGFEDDTEVYPPSHFKNLRAGRTHLLRDEAGALHATSYNIMSPTVSNADKVAGEASWKFERDGHGVGIGGVDIPAPWTVSVWVKRTTNRVGAALMSSRSPDGQYRYVRLQRTGTEVGVDDYDGTGCSFGYSTPLHQWTHLALVAESAGITLYVNGVAQSGTCASMPLPMGALSARGGDSLRAYLDELRIWDEALSREQVERLAAPDTPSAGLPTISGTARVGETLTADTSAIGDAVFSYQWVRSDGSDDADIENATSSTYILQDDDAGKTVKVRVSFAGDAGNQESVTSAATATVAKPLLTAELANTPSSHDGSTQFTFELRFSEEPVSTFSYVTLRDNAFTVEGGSVRNARRLDRPSNIRWEITVQPEGNGDVVITLPVTTNCAASGAVCTGDGRKLSNGLELVAGGPDS